MFTESNTVEALIRDLLCGGVTHHTAAGAMFTIAAVLFLMLAVYAMRKDAPFSSMIPVSESPMPAVDIPGLPVADTNTCPPGSAMRVP